MNLHSTPSPSARARARPPPRPPIARLCSTALPGGDEAAAVLCLCAAGERVLLLPLGAANRSYYYHAQSTFVHDIAKRRARGLGRNAAIHTHIHTVHAHCFENRGMRTVVCALYGAALRNTRHCHQNLLLPLNIFEISTLVRLGCREHAQRLAAHPARIARPWDPACQQVSQAPDMFIPATV